jgi:hypothetical protein
MEEKYMYKLGLMSDEPFKEEEPKSSNILVVEELINFALKKGVKLNRVELYDIYECQIEYFKFIGIVD